MENSILDKKKYVVARYWRGSYVETVCKPTSRDNAESLCDGLNESTGTVNEYKVKEI